MGSKNKGVPRPENHVAKKQQKNGAASRLSLARSLGFRACLPMPVLPPCFGGMADLWGVWQRREKNEPSVLRTVPPQKSDEGVVGLFGNPTTKL